MLKDKRVRKRLSEKGGQNCWCLNSIQTIYCHPGNRIWGLAVTFFEVWKWDLGAHKRYRGEFSGKEGEKPQFCWKLRHIWSVSRARVIMYKVAPTSMHIQVNCPQFRLFISDPKSSVGGHLNFISPLSSPVKETLCENLFSRSSDLFIASHFKGNN